MEFATKKECADLLAFLVVGDRIVTVRQVGEHLLLRVSTVLKGDQWEKGIGHRIHEAVCKIE